VDTEFLSFPQYRNQLQLLQIATPQAMALVDPQTISRDHLRALVEVLFKKELIFHAGGSTIFHRRKLILLTA